MKPIIPFALLSAFIAIPASAQGTAVTTPVGYTTVGLEPGNFNLVGVTLHEPTLLSGTFSGSNELVLEDSDADFTVLENGVTYILEITSGTGNGIIQEVFNPPSATELTTPEDISSFVDNTTTYLIRKATTLNSLLGEDNGVANLKESTDGGSSNADLVLLPAGDGTFDTFFYVRIPGTLEGWFDGAEEAGDVVLNYADGVFIRTRADSAAEDFVVSGEVKTTPTNSIINSGFNLVNSVAPAGLTLGTSGLSDDLSPSVDGGQEGADLVLIPSETNPGTFDTYFYVDIPGTLVGWFDGAEAADNVELTGGFFIRNAGDPKAYGINGPQIQSSL